MVAEGHSIPSAWDGTIEGLPAGIDAAIAGGVRLPGTGERPTALCALAIEIRPSRQGAGLSSRMVQAMAALGAAHGLGHLIAPVRPSWKERYPLTPIERYARWRRPDGLPFDPWMRVHARLGGEVLRPEPRSLQITGTVVSGSPGRDLRFPRAGSTPSRAGSRPSRSTARPIAAPTSSRKSGCVTAWAPAPPRAAAGERRRDGLLMDPLPKS